MAIGLRARRAQASQLQLGQIFGDARRKGKPLLVATVSSDEDKERFERAETVLFGAGDRDVAIRRLLIETATADRYDIRVLTGENMKGDSPSLVLLDGDPPRIAKELRLQNWHAYPKIEQFLRKVVPLNVTWLEQRVALLSRHDPEVVKQLRGRLAVGEPPGELGRYAPVVVVLEAFRRKGAAREKLLGELLVPRLIEPKKKGEEVVDCGLGALVLSPLGARFADVFMKPSRPGGDDRKT